MYRASAFAALLVGSVALAACGASSSSGSTTTMATEPARSGTVDVSAVDNNFRSQDLTVEVGSNVVWTNEGRTDHNIVPVGTTPFHVDSADFRPDSVYSWTADAPGQYHYYCSIHGTATAGMIGSITVVGR